MRRLLVVWRAVGPDRPGPDRVRRYIVIRSNVTEIFLRLFNTTAGQEITRWRGRVESVAKNSGPFLLFIIFYATPDGHN